MDLCSFRLLQAVVSLGQEQMRNAQQRVVVMRIPQNELALSHDTPISELEPSESNPLEALAELFAITDFAAVYLALASGERS